MEEPSLNLILEKLPSVVLIRFRPVNRQWKRLIDLILSKQRELILFFNCSPAPSRYWRHNDQRINPDNCLPSNSGIYLSQWVQRQFRDITSLMLVLTSPSDSFVLEADHAYDYPFNLKRNPELPDMNSFISYFQQLFHLQIVFRFSSDAIYEYQICSKKLKTFHLQGDAHLAEKSCRVESLVCENLIEFSTITRLKLRVASGSFTSQLKYLSCKSLDYNAKQIRFPAVEILVLQNQQKAIDLDDFPELKKLHFNSVEEGAYSEVFVGVLVQKSLRKRPLKIFLLGVLFSFERAELGNEQSYLTIRELYSRLMALERRTNYELTFFRELANISQELLFSADCRLLKPRATIDVEFLRLCIRCQEVFESNRIQRTLLYSDSLGQTLERLKGDNPNLYENLARCVHKVLFFEAITNKERLLNLKDFFQWTYAVYLREFDQGLLDYLPIILPHHDALFLIPSWQKKYTPIDCRFLSKLACLSFFEISAKSCCCLQDLRNIFTNCRYLFRGFLKNVEFIKCPVISGRREGGWRLRKTWKEKKFPDERALLEYLESHPELIPSVSKYRIQHL